MMQMIQRGLYIWFVILQSSLFSQSLPNDACSRAVTLTPNGEALTATNAQAGTTPSETPSSQPVSCVKTFENDLWYTFITSAEFSWYKVTITPTLCNSPAGLQAMLIESSSCQSEEYLFRSCMNPYEEKPIIMFLEEKKAGVPILVYVDGYDGTECTFNIRLEAFPTDPRNETDLMIPSSSYFGEYEISYEADNLQSAFSNNEIRLSWEHPTDQEVDFFLVQEVRGFRNEQKYAFLRQKLPARSTVVADVARYEFQDISRLFPGTERCYRVIAVNSKMEQTYSEISCVKITPIEHFFVSPVYPQGEQIMYFQFSRKKKDDIFFEVLNSQEEVVKTYTLDKKSPREGSLTIDMKMFPTGFYQLRATCKGSVYMREFQLEVSSKANR